MKEKEVSGALLREEIARLKKEKNAWRSGCLSGRRMQRR